MANTPDAVVRQWFVEFHGVAIALVRDGKIVEGWNCFDFLSMYQQIGWVKNPVLP